MDLYSGEGLYSGVGLYSGWAYSQGGFILRGGLILREGLILRGVLTQGCTYSWVGECFILSYMYVLSHILQDV